LRTELAANAAFPFQIQTGDATPTTAGVVLKEGLGLLFGGRKETLLFTVHFSLPTPRPATLAVHVARQGIGSHVSTVVWATTLSKRIAAEVSLDEKGKFQGDASLAARLNGDKALLKRSCAFSRMQANLGGVDVTVPRFFKLAPEGSGTALVVGTLPKVGMGIALVEHRGYGQLTQLFPYARCVPLGQPLGTLPPFMNQKVWRSCGSYPQRRWLLATLFDHEGHSLAARYHSLKNPC
jgi:hypothetical protein